MSHTVNCLMSVDSGMKMVKACRMAGIQVDANVDYSGTMVIIKCKDEDKNEEFSSIVRIYNDRKLDVFKRK